MVEEVEDTGKKANNSEPPFNYPNHPKLVLPSPPLTSLIGLIHSSGHGVSEFNSKS